MLNTKRMRFPIDIILVCIRWYAAYPLSYRHIEEMMEERGVFVGFCRINYKNAYFGRARMSVLKTGRIYPASA